MAQTFKENGCLCRAEGSGQVPASEEIVEKVWQPLFENAVAIGVNSIAIPEKMNA